MFPGVFAGGGGEVHSHMGNAIQEQSPDVGGIMLSSHQINRICKKYLSKIKFGVNFGWEAAPCPPPLDPALAYHISPDKCW